MWYTWSACLPGQRHLRGTPPATTNQAGQRATWDVGLWLFTCSQLHTDIFDDQLSPNTLPLHNSQTLKVQFTTETPKLHLDVHSWSHACTTWALYAIFGQKISRGPTTASWRRRRATTSPGRSKTASASTSRTS